LTVAKVLLSVTVKLVNGDDDCDGKHSILSCRKAKKQRITLYGNRRVESGKKYDYGPHGGRLARPRRF